MTVQNIDSTQKKTEDARGGLTAGIILIVIGLGLLASRFLSLDNLFPLGLGMIFILAGVLKRSAGLLIPGGIISGVGLGIVVTQNGLLAGMGVFDSGALMLLCMAVGWFSIIVLSKLFTDETQIWPVFPGGAMAVIGSLMLMGANGLEVLKFLGSYWPAVLILIGISVMVQAWREQTK
jgi:hypothetical protein